MNCTFTAAVIVGCLAFPIGAQDIAMDPRKHRASAFHPGTAFKAEASLVLIPASVTDRNGGTVNGLGADNFLVFENAIPRPSISFSSQDAPCSVGIVFDTSGSMKKTISKSRIALRAPRRSRQNRPMAVTPKPAKGNRTQDKHCYNLTGMFRASNSA